MESTAGALALVNDLKANPGYVSDGVSAKKFVDLLRWEPERCVGSRYFEYTTLWGVYLSKIPFYVSEEFMNP